MPASIEECISSLWKGTLSLRSAVTDILYTLQTFAKEKKLPQFLLVHANLCEMGLDVEASPANLLIASFPGVGSTWSAQQVFDKIQRHQHVRNLLIASFAGIGTVCYAQQASNKMINKDLHSAQVFVAGYPCDLHHQKTTFVALIKACAASKDLERGSSLHAEVARLGLIETDVFVDSTLVDMYGKCGSVTKAEEVFKRILIRDVVSWTALITGYAEHGPYEEAFEYAGLMQQEGICPNSFTLVALLKACSHLLALDKGEEIHTEATLKGYEREELIGNSLVDMYAKCRCLAAAYAVFNWLHVRNVVSWTTLIAGYVDCGHSEEALHCYKQMQQSGSLPNIVTFICTSKACGSIVAITEGRQVHTEIVSRGLESDIRIGNTLMDMYFKCGLLADAETSFDKLPHPDVISWNILLAAYSEHSSVKKALAFFEEMQSKGFSVDKASTVSLVRACTKLHNAHKGMEAHLIAAKTGLDQKLPVVNALVGMYGKLGLLMEAQHSFDKLLIRSLVSWNALIAGYAEHADAEEALQCYHEMQCNFCPDVVTFICILKTCAGTGNRRKGQEIHREIVKLGMEEMSQVGNSLIHMYAKCGSLAEAQEIFDHGLLIQDMVSWTALMMGWAQFGKSTTVLVMFGEMVREGVTPNAVTLTCVLNACSDEGILSIDESCLRIINENSGFIPTLEHYTCLIDVLGRAGLIDEAIRITEEMPMKPDICVWLSVLGACRNSCNVELGKLAFENALQLDRKNEAAYLCMHNIFMEAGMHDEALAVEMRRGQIHT